MLLVGPALAWPCDAFCAVDVPATPDCHESKGELTDRLTGQHDCSGHPAPAALTAWLTRVNADLAFEALASVPALHAPPAGVTATDRDTSSSAPPPSLTAFQVPLRL